MRSPREIVVGAAWPRWRAGLIALVLLVHACAATPFPRRIRPEDARTPTAQEELGLWLKMLGKLGVRATQDQLLDLVNAAADLSLGVRDVVIEPFRPLLRITGTGQAWALFAYPERYPNHLQIEVREPAGGWRLVYAAADPERRFLADQLAFRRIRGVYDTAASRGAPGAAYDRFTDWVAREAFAAYPDATDVRVKMLQKRVTLPDEDPAEEEKTRLVRLRSRDQMEKGT